jgi:hypothetical protein
MCLDATLHPRDGLGNKRKMQVQPKKRKEEYRDNNKKIGLSICTTPLAHAHCKSVTLAEVPTN